MDWSKLLLELRNASGLSGAHVARSVGITKQSLWAIERGGRPSLETLESLLEFYGMALTFGANEGAGTMSPDEAQSIAKMITAFGRMDRVARAGLVAQFNAIAQHVLDNDEDSEDLRVG